MTTPDESQVGQEEQRHSQQDSSDSSRQGQGGGTNGGAVSAFGDGQNGNEGWQTGTAQSQPYAGQADANQSFAGQPYQNQQAYDGAPYGGQPYGGQYYAGGQPFADQQYAAQPNGGQPFANQPYGGQPYGPSAPYMAPQYVRRPKSKIVAGLLGIFLGIFGAHNFYLGHNERALAQLLLTLLGWMVLFIGPVVSFIWGLVEGVLILSSQYGSPWHRDAYGLELND